MKVLRLKFSSMDVSAIDKALYDLLDVLKKEGVGFIGPIPLPSSKERFKAVERKLVTYRRLIDIVKPNMALFEKLSWMGLSDSVKVEFKEISF